MAIIVIRFAAVIVALAFHEFSHALVAYLQGDNTAKYAGRLTLNPLAHIDPIGTVILPLMLSISGLPSFGWAKPVPYNPYNLKNGRFGPVFVGLAGPASNLVLFAVSTLLFHALVGPLGPSNLLVIFLYALAIVNVGLGLFNLLPVPPLDGSKVLLAYADRPSVRPIAHFVTKNGLLILLAYIYLNTPGLTWAYAKLIQAAGLL